MTNADDDAGGRTTYVRVEMWSSKKRYYCFNNVFKRFILLCEKGHSFKYGTGLEKNKLFVKGLPTSATKADLEALFGKFGKLLDVRLPTFRRCGNDDDDDDKDAVDDDGDIDS